GGGGWGGGGGGWAGGPPSHPRDPDHSRLPGHRSPWVRAGRSRPASPAYPSMFSITSSTRAASAPDNEPLSTDLRRYGASLRAANQAGHDPGKGPGEGSLGSGRDPM